jgi:hypothetical protein
MSSVLPVSDSIYNFSSYPSSLKSSPQFRFLHCSAFLHFFSLFHSSICHHFSDFFKGRFPFFVHSSFLHFFSLFHSSICHHFSDFFKGRFPFFVHSSFRVFHFALFSFGFFIFNLWRARLCWALLCLCSLFVDTLFFRDVWKSVLRTGIRCFFDH